VRRILFRATGITPPSLSLYTILSLPILCAIYCDNGGSGENVTLRNSVGDDGGGGVPKQRVGVQRRVLIRAHTPKNKTISCIGQLLRCVSFYFGLDVSHLPRYNIRFFCILHLCMFISCVQVRLAACSGLWFGLPLGIFFGAFIFCIYREREREGERVNPERGRVGGGGAERGGVKGLPKFTLDVSTNLLPFPFSQVPVAAAVSSNNFAPSQTNLNHNCVL